MKIRFLKLFIFVVNCFSFGQDSDQLTKSALAPFDTNIDLQKMKMLIVADYAGAIPKEFKLFLEFFNLQEGLKNELSQLNLNRVRIKELCEKIETIRTFCKKEFTLLGHGGTTGQDIDCFYSAIKRNLGLGLFEWPLDLEGTIFKKLLDLRALNRHLGGDEQIVNPLFHQLRSVSGLECKFLHSININSISKIVMVKNYWLTIGDTSNCLNLYNLNGALEDKKIKLPFKVSAIYKKGDFVYLVASGSRIKNCHSILEDDLLSKTVILNSDLNFVGPLTKDLNLEFSNNFGHLSKEKYLDINPFNKNLSLSFNKGCLIVFNHDRRQKVYETKVKKLSQACFLDETRIICLQEIGPKIIIFNFDTNSIDYEIDFTSVAG